MESPIERFRLSQTAKDSLIKLKRYTKIDQWNILCRWAFCRSLAEPSLPSPVPIPADSNVELSWKVFGGEMADIFLIALKQRCHQDGLATDKETLTQQFRNRIRERKSQRILNKNTLSSPLCSLCLCGLSLIKLTLKNLRSA